VVLTVAILLALVLPWPWNAIVIALGVVGEVGEIVWGRRLARRWRARTGPEAMIGAQAEVVAACLPDGSVRVHGELWEAHCDEGVNVGETVRIAALEGLTLTVVREAEHARTATP